MKRALLPLGLVLFVLALDGPVVSRSNGMLPTPALPLTRDAASSCGGSGSGPGCHRLRPFLTEVSVAVGQRVLNLNGTTAVRVSAVNPGVSGNRAGFCADTTQGVLVAGANTQINAAGNAITHVNSFATGRSWAFNYRGTTTGLSEFYVVANAVNGNGLADGGDDWAFHSSKLLATVPTPVRMFVNAAGVQATGPGCDDGYGNFSVLGARTSPTTGNVGFKLEAHGLPASAQFMIMMSVGGGAPPIDMTLMGAPGCFLRTAMQLNLSGTTSGGDSLRGEGTVIMPLPIPNDPNLKGLVLSLQAGALDGNSKRSFPMIVTNGIELTIQ